MANKNGKQKSSILKLLLASLSLVICMLTFSACTWFTKDPVNTGNSNYDANGNLRIQSVNLHLNRPNDDGSVSDITGSFYWQLNYYFSFADKQLANTLSDQSNYSSYYDTAEFNSNLVNGSVYLHKDAQYFYNNNQDLPYSVSTSGYYTVTLGENSNVVLTKTPGTITLDDAKKVKFLQAGNTYYNDNISYNVNSTGFYLVETISGKVYASQVYNAYTTGALNLTNSYGSTFDGNFNGIGSIKYPSFNISVSGIMYQVKVEADISKLTVDFNDNQLFKISNTDANTQQEEDALANTKINDIFKLSYRVGTSGNWIENSAIIKAYQKNGKFYAQFNPALAKGSTSRYIRVQSVTNEYINGQTQTRGESVMTSPLNFNVYKLTFSVAANNSTYSTYESLTYDDSKYYFAESIESLNDGLLGGTGEGKNGYKYYSSLTGYFVEGKIVNVNRYVASNGDYALANWTVNGKADNSRVIESTLPDNNGGYHLFISENNPCLSDYSLKIAGVKLVSINEASNLNINDSSKNFNEQFSNVNGGKKGTLSVVSCVNTASNNFYANATKVKNYTLSGTIFDGDNFFTSGSSARLDDVEIYIWREGEDAPLCKYAAGNGQIKFDSNINATAYNNYCLDLNTNLENSCSYTNGQFVIGGLAYNCYITFNKVEKDTSDNSNTQNMYTFYSVSMRQKGDTYILDPLKQTDLYSDRAGNAIIGTKFDASSKVQVNLYVADTQGTLTPIGETKISGNGIAYQVISTTTTSTDAFGYVTSSVIISILLPSNASLISYNLESINSIGSALYLNKADASDYIFLDIGYDQKNRVTTNTYYHVTKQDNISDVTSGTLLNALRYDGQFYQYTHKDVSIQDGTNVYNYYYAYDKVVDGKLENKYVIKRSELNNITTYTHYTYTPIDQKDITIQPTEETENGKIKISAVIKYNNVEYDFSTKNTTSSDVAVSATAYLTDLYYQIPKTDENGKPILDENNNPVYLHNQSMYVYYNITNYTFKAGAENKTENFYTAPLGKQTSIFENNNTYGTFETSIVWYHQELNHSNISQLIEKNHVMLGADILSGKGNTNFLNATDGGKNIIANNYYYVKPLGESTELLLSQYISTDAKEIESQEYVYYILNDDNSYVLDKNGNKILYTDVVYKRINKVSFAITGLFVNPSNDNTGSFKSDYVNYTWDKSGKLYYTIGDNKTPYQSSLTNDANDYKLYKFEDNKYSAFALKNGIGELSQDQKDFINQEQDNTLVPNIDSASVTNNGEEIYVIARRKFLQFSSVDGNQDSTKSFTTVYKFYTYSDNSDKLIESNILFDGKNFFLATDQYINLTDSETNTSMAYPVILKLQKNADGKIYYQSENSYIEFMQQTLPTSESSKYKIVNQFTANLNGKTITYNNIVVRKFYEELTNTDGNQKNENLQVKLGYEWNIGVGTTNSTDATNGTATFTPLYILTNSKAGIVNIDYQFYGKDDNNTEIKLKAEITTVVKPNNDSVVIRKAVLSSNINTDVHLVGKVELLAGGNYIVYPSYNFNLKNNDQSVLSVNNGELKYYTIDYTTKDNVISAFPGVTILSGAPYTNPVFYFSVRHKANQLAVIDLGLEIVNSYYVEVITNAITSTSKNVIYDFSTVSFKDTIANLNSNDYINRMYYVVDGITQNTITAYTKNSDGSFAPYLGGTPLTIQNIGINNNDPYVYASNLVNENGIYLTPLYYKTNNGGYSLLEHSKLIIWSSSAESIENLPSFDLHSYYVTDNGMIVLSSSGDANQICEKLENLFISGTGSTSSVYDYDEVLIAGTTSAYRVNAKDIEDISNRDLQSYWWESAINIANSYNSTDPYFLTGKEGVVLVANPVVNLGQENVIYRFKRWAIYSRYNSETLYYNSELSLSHPDINNAVMRFTSALAGYFVFMPIYERVYTLNIGTSIEESDKTLGGGLNLGGSVSVEYDGTSVNMPNSNYGENALDISFIEYLKTTQGDKSAYYYNNLQITPLLYFTGDFYSNGYPIFEQRTDIFTYKYTKNDITYTLYFSIQDGELVNIPVINNYVSGAGIIAVNANNGRYTFVYGANNTNQSLKSFLFSDTIPGQDNQIGKLLSYTYNVDYYLDGVTTNNDTQATSSKFVIYNNLDNSFYAIDNKQLYNNASSIKSVLEFVIENGTKFAVAKNKKFNSIESASGDSVTTDNMYFSSLAYLASGELYSYIDANGTEQVYTSQQFKTSYFERDTKLIISANADLGYRLKNWYLAKYNSQTNSWIIDDTPLSESVNASYKDIIRDVYYNVKQDTWYYVTDYFTEIDGQKVYYYTKNADNTYSNPSVVNSDMISSVCGYYAEVSSNSGVKYIPVYRRDYMSSDWYLDQNFTQAYTGSTSKISLKSHRDAIYSITTSGETTYYIGNTMVYLNSKDNQYYRTLETANMTFSDNKIYINNLHSDIRVIATFVEVYQSYIFAEDSSEDNIDIVSVYYSGIRSDDHGNQLDNHVNSKVNCINKSDFYLNGSSVPALIDPTKYVGTSAYGTLIDENSKIVNKKVLAENGEKTDLNLVNMNFDVHSSVFIVVKVYYDKTLNIHSLGMNTSYTLTPVVYPTDEYIAKNMSASARDDYYFYVFKVTFDRDLSFYSNVQTIKNTNNISSTITGSNYNPEYLVHTNRGKALVADIFAGNYTKFYRQLFSFVDQTGETITFKNAVDPNKFMLSDTYVNILSARLHNLGLDIYKKDNNGNIIYNNKVPVLNNESASILTSSYTNLAELFDALKQKYQYILSIKNIINNYAVKDAAIDIKAGTILTGLKDILSVIDYKFTNKTTQGGFERKVAPLKSGSTNFINLSSIPVYTYTTNIKIVDSTSNGLTTFADNKDFDDLQLAQKLYTRGGYMGYTYIGLGNESSINTTLNVNGYNVNYSKYYEGYTTENEVVDLFANDYALAKDTIMVLQGLDESTIIKHEVDGNSTGIYYYLKDGVKYIFTGWYEQKAVTKEVDGKTIKVWGDMQLVSSNPTTPFESVAYADTNIIALFERAVELEFVAPENALTINFNSLKDDLNQNINISYKDVLDGINLLYRNTIISGVFTVSSLLNIDVTPSGGYRFTNTLDYNTYTGLGNSSAGNIALGGTTKNADYGISILQGSDVNQDFANLNLVKTITLSCHFGKLVDKLSTSTTGKIDKTTNKVSISFNMAEVMLTYIQIDGYTKLDDNGAITSSGVEFNLYLDNGKDNWKTHPIVITSFEGNIVKNIANNKIKDSAQRDIILEVQNGSLKIYGYFDKTYNSKLYIKEVNSDESTQLKAWYINEYFQDSRDTLDPYIIVEDKDVGFNLAYWYYLDNNNTNLYLQDKATKENITVTNSDISSYNNKFNLSENNFTYVLRATIEAKSQVFVDYIKVDNINDVNSNQFVINDENKINRDKNGTITWTGKKINNDNTYSANGTEDFTDGFNNYAFTSNTKITLSNSLEYTESSAMYKFIGWFTLSGGKLQLVSNSNTWDGLAIGHFVALFAKSAKVIDVYSILENDNTDINSHAKIDIVSNYKLTMITSAVGENIQTTKVDTLIDVFYNINNINYVVVGSSVTVNVSADNGYLVKDIVYSAKSSDEQVQKTNIGKQQASANINNISNDDCSIYAQISEASYLKVAVYYYDSVASTNTPQLYLGNNATAKVDGVSALVTSGSAYYSQFAYLTGSKVQITYFDNLYGLIGFYVDGQKLESNYNTQTKLHTLEYTLSGSQTIEVRITRYVLVNSNILVNGNQHNTNNITNTINYTDYYTNTLITHTFVNKSDSVKVLSGTIVNVNSTVKSSGNTGFAFLQWDSLATYSQEAQTGYYIENIGVSTTPSYKEEIVFNSGIYDANDSYYITLVSNYSSAVKINVNKFLQSYNQQDKAYITNIDKTTGTLLDGETSFDATPDFWSLLDVLITYTDINGNIQELMLGSQKELHNIFVKAGTSLTVKPIVSKALESRYASKIEYDGKIYNESLQVSKVTKNETFNLQFYANRSVTIVRQVNNQESTLPRNHNISLSFTYNNANTNFISNTSTRLTVNNLSNHYNIKVTAGMDSKYVFGGFYVNGVAVISNYITDNQNYHYTLNILPGEKEPTSDTYYTNDTDLTIVALWYTTSIINTSITLDDKDISNDYSNQANVSHLNGFRLYGNKITKQENAYNTALQAVTVTNGDQFNYLAGNNLAMIASTFVGYQFVGFYYRDLSLDNSQWKKLQFLNYNDDGSSYNYGDTLTSIINGNLLQYGKEYEIQARYLTAFNFSSLSTLLSQANDHELGGTSIIWKQVTKDINGNFNVIASDVHAGDKNNAYYNDYFYPALGNYVAVKETYAKESFPNGVTPAGYYLNGQLIIAEGTIAIDGQSYNVFKLGDFVNEDGTLNVQDGNTFDRSNYVLEIKVIENVEFVIRLGINNTNDINSLGYLGLDAEKLKNISVVLTCNNPYTKEEISTIYTSTDENGNSYFNNDNSSLYIRIVRPIGSKVTATIKDDNDTSGNNITVTGNNTYLYNGWFMYSGASVATSTAVINYTDNVSFTLTDNTDIVAQFLPDKIIYTVDQQVSFNFYGENFKTSTYAPTFAGEITNNYYLATSLANYLKSNDIVVEETFTSTDNLGTETITIIPRGNGIYSINHTYVGKNSSQNNINETREYLFLGWYQEVKDAREHNKLMYINNTLSLLNNSDAQLKNATNLTAVFTQIVNIQLSQNISNGMEIYDMQFNYSSFIPALASGDVSSELFKTTIDANGNVNITTLYGTDYKIYYRSAYGYHFSNKNNTPTENNRYTHISTSNTFTENTITGIVNFVTGNPNLAVAKNKYSYSVSQSNMQVNNLKANAKCASNNDHFLKIDENKISSFANFRISDDYFEIEETPDTSEDILGHISGQIISPNNTTDINVTIVIRYPNGSTEELILNKNNMFAFKDVDLPVGTTIYLKNQNLVSISEVFDSIKLYALTLENFLNPNYQVLPTEEIENIFTKQESNAFIITEDLFNKFNSNNGGLYLRIVVQYTNIFALELEANKPEEGSASVNYSSSEGTTSTYNFNVDAKNNFAFDNLNIRFKESTASDNIETSLLELLTKLTLDSPNSRNSYAHLSQFIYAFYTGSTVQESTTSGNWAITLSKNTDTDVISVKLVYTNDNITYVDATFNFKLINDADKLGFKYITGISANITINTNVIVSTEYAHIANVTTAKTIESFDANSKNGYTSSITDKNKVLLYIFDTELYTEDTEDSINDPKYIEVINKLISIYYSDIFGTKNPDGTVTESPYQFIGFVYAGSILSHTINKIDPQSNVLIYNKDSAEKYCSDNVFVEALFVQKLVTNIGLDIKYYNTEINSELTDNPNILNTPLDNVILFVDGNGVNTFTSSLSTNAVYSNQNATTNLLVKDSKDYFTFDYWVVKYGNKYLATQNGEIYKLDYSSLNVNTDLLITILNQYKASENFANLDTGIFAKYKDGVDSESINLSAFTICAHITEQPIQIDINYSTEGEQFNVSISDINNTIFTGDINEYILLKNIENLPYNIAINKLERYVDDQGNEVNNSTTTNTIKDFRLVIAYSKAAIESINSVEFAIKATNYTKGRNNSQIAKTTLLQEGSAIRVISLEDNQIGNNTYLLLDGFKTQNGSLQLSDIDKVKNVLKFYSTSTTTGEKHSYTYTMQTTPLYLVELGLARNENIFPGNESYLQIIIDGTTYSQNNPTSLDPNKDNYAALSYLVKEGTVVKTCVINNGNANSSFKTLAISSSTNLLSVSDIYSKFMSDDYNNLSNIESATESHWRKALNMIDVVNTDTKPADYYSNNYYQTLYQFSNLNISNSSTEYTFAATKNISIIADYIDLFREQQKYISIIINSDNSIKYHPKDDKGSIFTGENFIISANTNGSKLDYILPEEINNNLDYTLQPDVIIKNKSDENCTNDATIDKNKKDKPLTLTQAPCQLSVGLVTNKKVSINILAAQKYKVLDKSILAALASGYNNSLYNDKLINGYQRYSTDGIYVLQTDNTDKEAVIKSILNRDENQKALLQTTGNIQKDSNVHIIATQKADYNFIGFMLISQNGGMYIDNFEQNLTSAASSFGNKQAYRIDTAKRILHGNSITIENQVYYHLQIKADGNTTVIALYEPMVYLVNIIKKTYNESQIKNNEYFKPNFKDDESTTQGKVVAESYVVKKGQLLELAVATNGFSEFKGVASVNQINAIYSTDGSINGSDLSSITSDAIDPNKEPNKKSVNAILDILKTGVSGDTVANAFPLLHYYNGETHIESRNISSSVVYGHIDNSKLFTSKYSQNIDGKFQKNTAAISYLYLDLGDITNDVNLYTYFNPIYYDLEVDFGEISTGYTDKNQYTGNSTVDKDNLIGNSPYIAYSDAYINNHLVDGKWKNPSANPEFGIKESDPYIYTWIDNAGNTLSYPVKLTADMINPYDPNNPYQYMTLKLNANDQDKIIREVCVANPDGERILVPYLTTIETTDKNNNLITQNVLSYNSKYVNKTIDNVYDYIIKNGESYSLKPNLFKFIINNTQYDSKEFISTQVINQNNLLVMQNVVLDNNILEIVIDFNTEAKPSIKINAKIFADPNSGFPGIGISRVNLAINDAIVFNQISVDEYADINKISNKINSASINEYFFKDAFTTDAETGFINFKEEYKNNLKVKMSLAFQRNSKEVEAQISFTNGKPFGANLDDTITLTNPNKNSKSINNKTSNQVELLQYINQLYHGTTETNNGHNCKEHSNTYCVNGDDCGMIDMYHLYIIKNAQMYIDALEYIIDKASYRKSTILNIITEILAFNPASGLTAPAGDKSAQETMFNKLPKTGNIFDYIGISKQSLIDILKYEGFNQLSNRLQSGNTDDLTFTQLDVYSNFKKQINKNFFGNSISYGDIVVSVNKLSEHKAPHKVDYFAGNPSNFITEESERGYYYINNAKTQFMFNYVSNALVTTYENDFEKAAASFLKLELTTGQALVNWWAGITNRQAKYAGTYTYIMHAGLMPTASDFTAQHAGAFILNTNIDLSIDSRIKTANCDKMHGSLGETIIGGFIGAATVVGGALTGGLLGGLIIAAGASLITISVVDGIKIVQGLNAEELTPLHNIINNLDFSFD